MNKQNTAPAPEPENNTGKSTFFKWKQMISGRGEALFTEEELIQQQIDNNLKAKPSIQQQIEWIKKYKDVCRQSILYCEKENLVHMHQERIEELHMLTAIHENLIAVRLFNSSSPGERMKFLMKKHPL